MLLTKCINHLQKDGVIIIREGNAELERRHKGTKLSELFSTRLLGFNKTSGNGLSFLQAATIHDMAAKHKLECQEFDESKLTSNIIFILQQKAAVAAV